MILHESGEYIEAIIKASIDGIAVVDDKGKIEFGNDSFFNIAGWPKEDLIDQNFINIFPEECHEFLRGRWTELQCGTGISYETKIKTIQGEIRYIYISQSKAEIEGTIRDVAIIKDISEKKKLELTLKESEEKYRDFFDNAIDSVYINDAEGYILNVNKTTLEYLDCEPKDIIGTHGSKWFTPESWKLTQETLIKRSLGEPVEDPMIREMVSKSGEHRWAEIRSRMIKDGDRIVGYQGIARDITENVRLKQELKKSNKQRKLLCYLIEGTRGGKTRALILKHLVDEAYNAHQLSKALNMDYKTVRHHLDVLLKNKIITKNDNVGTTLYLISKNIELDLNEFNA